MDGIPLHSKVSNFFHRLSFVPRLHKQDQRGSEHAELSGYALIAHNQGLITGILTERSRSKQTACTTETIGQQKCLRRSGSTREEGAQKVRIRHLPLAGPPSAFWSGPWPHQYFKPSHRLSLYLRHLDYPLIHPALAWRTHCVHF